MNRGFFYFILCLGASFALFAAEPVDPPPCEARIAALGHLLHAAFALDKPTRHLAAEILGERIPTSKARDLFAYRLDPAIHRSVHSFWIRILDSQEPRGNAFLSWYREAQVSFGSWLDSESSENSIEPNYNSSIFNRESLRRFFGSWSPFTAVSGNEESSSSFIYPFGHPLLMLETQWVMIRKRFDRLQQNDIYDIGSAAERAMEWFAFALVYERLLVNLMEAQRHYDLEGIEASRFGRLVRKADFLPDDEMPETQIDRWMGNAFGGAAAPIKDSLLELISKMRDRAFR